MKYILLPSTRKHKKYMAVFVDSTKKAPVHFGDNRYPQYKDSSGLGKYTHLNHGDAARRRRYYQRHGKDAVKFSAKYFSHKYLW
jgi:tetrahydromethanopterin S-methyltransferase subunit E